MVTGAVAVIVHHVEDVALGPLVRDRASVVRTVDVKVVVDADVDVVITPVKPGRERAREDRDVNTRRVFSSMHGNSKADLNILGCQLFISKLQVGCKSFRSVSADVQDLQLYILPLTAIFFLNVLRFHHKKLNLQVQSEIFRKKVKSIFSSFKGTLRSF